MSHRLLKARTVLLTLIAVASLVGVEEIHDAVKAGDLAGVRRLLDARPELVKAANERGYTPLHIAAHEGA